MVLPSLTRAGTVFPQARRPSTGNGEHAVPHRRALIGN